MADVKVWHHRYGNGNAGRIVEWKPTYYRVAIAPAPIAGRGASDVFRTFGQAVVGADGLAGEDSAPADWQLDRNRN